MEHLLDFFDRYVRGSSEALVFDDGFRRWSYSHDQLRAAAEGFARRLTEAGLTAGDRVIIWSDSRPEWIAAFWGCVLDAVPVIPVDASSSPALVRRIIAVAAPRIAVVGNDTDASVLPPSISVWRVGGIHWSDPGGASRPPAAPSRIRVDADTVVEIVFTSGTTGEPKGVVITHGNIVANITPIEREVRAYQRFLWAFRPIRFLCLLPLSHMFGQALGIFFPPLVNAAAVFMAGYNPDRIVAQVRRHRITLVVTVPRMLEMLRDRIGQLAPRCAAPEPIDRPLIVRLWRYRQAHRRLGWRFCGFVLGGAELDRPLEDFWQRLGYAVIQGYGLTETAPIVAWNHPFRMKHGTVGRPLDGVAVRIAADGEVLVKGPTVTSGYVNAPEETRSALEGGWFHTGDIGAFDESGHLVIRGRKKDVIATPEGLKVFPEDVERVLEAMPGVREAAVVGRREDHAESVHAVLVLRPGADPAQIVRDANGALEAHQRIRGFSVCTGGALPRTEPMRKLKRFEIRRWVEEGAPERPAGEAPGASVEGLLAKYVRDRRLTSDTTLDELGLTSLDRIELTTALEDRARVGLSDAAISEARTIGDLRRLTEQAAETGATAEEPFAFPRWNRWPLVRLIRNVSQRTWILPLAHSFFRLQVEGGERVLALEGPILFAANHQSHFDTPVILSALPRHLRRALAVSMGMGFFEPYFFPDHHARWERFTRGGLYGLAALFFRGFPLPQKEPGVRHALRYMGELATNRDSILIFPEGHRTVRGEIQPFQPGVAMIASKLRMPVVPVRLEGVDRVLHKTWRWPRRGNVRVAFGEQLVLEGDDYIALTRRVEDAVLALRPLQLAPAHRVPDAAA